MSSYLSLPGTLGNTASSPDSALLALADIEVQFEVALDDYTPGATKYLGGKAASGTSREWFLALSSAGILSITVSADGGSTNQTTYSASTALPGTNGAKIAGKITFDADNGAAGSTARFYYADSVAGPWTQLGSDVTGTQRTPFNGTSALEMGGLFTGGLAGPAGKLYRWRVYDGIGGTLVFDPRFDQQAAGTTSFAEDANGATVTINQNGDPAARIVFAGRSRARRLYMHGRR